MSELNLPGRRPESPEKKPKLPFSDVALVLCGVISAIGALFAFDKINRGK